MILPSTGADYRWYSSIEKSDESRSTIINYSELDVFYQNNYLDFQIEEDISRYDKVYIQVENGDFGIWADNNSIYANNRYYGPFFYGERGPVNILEEDYYLGELNGYYLKPYEKDVNFNLTLKLVIIENDLITYMENHTFYIVGEPIVIPGDDINVGLPIWEFIILSITISIIFWILFYIIIFKEKKQRGKTH